MSLEKIKLEALDSATQATVADGAKLSGQDKAFVSKAVRTAELEAVAAVDTGSPGRPPKVFNRQELLAAVNTAVKVAEEAAALAAHKKSKEDSSTSV